MYTDYWLTNAWDIVHNAQKLQILKKKSRLTNDISSGYVLENKYCKPICNCYANLSNVQPNHF